MLVFQVYYSSRLATDGDRMMEINSKLNDLNEQNAALKTKIYQLTTIENIHKYALASGMIPATIANLGSISVAVRVGLP